VPSRPPAEPGVRIPDAEQLNRAERAFEAAGLSMQTLTDHEGDRSMTARPTTG